MSTAAATLRGALVAGADSEVAAASAAMSALKVKLLKFLNKIPNHCDDIDPATLRRLPVPY
jgi:hypothetical protein